MNTTFTIDVLDTRSSASVGFAMAVGHDEHGRTMFRLDIGNCRLAGLFVVINRAFVPLDFQDDDE